MLVFINSRTIDIVFLVVVIFIIEIGELNCNKKCKESNAVQLGPVVQTVELHAAANQAYNYSFTQLHVYGSIT